MCIMSDIMSVTICRVVGIQQRCRNTTIEVDKFCGPVTIEFL